MDLALWLSNLGALITLGLGGLGLVSPARAAAFTSIAPVGALGVSEIRATYGGLFLSLALGCLLTQRQLAFNVVGFAWLGAAAGRVVSVVVDRNTQAKNWGAIVFEAAIGSLLLARWIAT